MWHALQSSARFSGFQRLFSPNCSCFCSLLNELHTLFTGLVCSVTHSACAPWQATQLTPLSARSVGENVFLSAWASFSTSTPWQLKHCFHCILSATKSILLTGMPRRSAMSLPSPCVSTLVASLCLSDLYQTV